MRAEGRKGCGAGERTANRRIRDLAFVAVEEVSHEVLEYGRKCEPVMQQQHNEGVEHLSKD